MLPPTIYGFKVNSELEKGSFASLISVTNIANSHEYVMKVEKKSSELPQLRYEAKLYRYLHEDKEAYIGGIPRYFGYFEKSQWNCLVIEKMGFSLERLFQSFQSKFTMKTTLMLAEDMLTRIEYLHSRGIIHRDVKPGNFVVGDHGNEKKLYIVDFGVSKRYASRTGEHIRFAKGKCMIGTARFSSIGNHLGIEQSRRDDLESLGYSLVYFAKGTLPWIGIPCKSKADKYSTLLEIKRASLSAILCEGLPQEFQQYFDYVRSLEFEQIPDYGFLRKLFRQIMFQNRYNFDKAYDWTDEGLSELHKRGQFKGFGGFGSLTPLASLLRGGAISNINSLSANSSLIPKGKPRLHGAIRFERNFQEDNSRKSNYFLKLVLKIFNLRNFFLMQ